MGVQSEHPEGGVRPPRSWAADAGLALLPRAQAHGLMRYAPKYIDRSRCFVVYDRDFETNAALARTDVPLTMATREEAQEIADRLNGGD